MLRRCLHIVAITLVAGTALSAQAPSTAWVEQLLANPGKGNYAGLSLGEAFNIDCTGFRITVWSPTAAILGQARKARQEMRPPLTIADIDADTLAGAWRVAATASTPTKMQNMNRACADSVSHVVLRNKDKSIVIQPITKAPSDNTIRNGLGAAYTFTGIDATFPGAGVMELWGPKQDQPFWVSVIGVRGWKYDFEIKEKHFASLK